VEPLVEVLKDGPGNARVSAAEALGEINDAKALGVLVRALADGPTCYAARLALTKMGKPAVSNLIAALRDRAGPELARASAALALGDIGDVAAIEPLAAVLKNNGEKAELRAYAAAALGRIGVPLAVEQLKAVLQDGEETVRGAAQRALAAVEASQHAGP
jgi:HEAT repeat protein